MTAGRPIDASRLALHTAHAGVRALSGALDFLFPPRCPACGERTQRVALCARCSAAIAPARSPLCPSCGESFPGSGPDHHCSRCLARPPHFDRARACALYRSDRSSPLIDVLHRFKYGRDVTLAPLLGDFLADRCPLPVDHDLLVPVPLDLGRLRWRGFNQAAALARALAARRRRPLHPMALQRCRATPPQVGLGEDDRRRNMAGAFAVRDRTVVHGRAILLIDDVMTTGATVEECAKTLRRAGARRVDVVVLARAADV
jgi:ComF family protein